MFRPMMLSTEALHSKIYLRTSSRGILHSDNNHFKIGFSDADKDLCLIDDPKITVF